MSRAGEIESRSRVYLSPVDWDFKVSHDDMAYLVEMAKRAEAAQRVMETIMEERMRRLGEGFKPPLDE